MNKCNDLVWSCMQEAAGGHGHGSGWQLGTGMAKILHCGVSRGRERSLALRPWYVPVGNLGRVVGLHNYSGP